MFTYPVSELFCQFPCSVSKNTGSILSLGTTIELSSYLLLVILQLRIEQRRGRVFVGWNEGKIYFPPTYKYSTNSDRYAGDDMHPKEKRRTPAW